MRIELFIPVIPLQEQILQRAVLMPVGEREVWVTTAEDLILLKLAFHRAKDLQDVRGILWVQRGHLDVDYLTTWGAKTLDAAGQNELDRLITESNQASKE